VKTAFARVVLGANEAPPETWEGKGKGSPGDAGDGASWRCRWRMPCFTVQKEMSAGRRSCYASLVLVLLFRWYLKQL